MCEPVDFPECDLHIEVQHRDGRRPWCRTCGWNRGRRAVAPAQIVDVLRDTTTDTPTDEGDVPLW